MSNFPISQVKFNMQILHWITVKVFYRKPKNWGKLDEFNLYLMWDLLTNYAFDWVGHIIEWTLQCRDNPKRPMFFSSFVKLILEVNEIVSKKEDLVEAPKIFDEFGVYKMRYYKDTHGDYFNTLFPQLGI